MPWLAGTASRAFSERGVDVASDMVTVTGMSDNPKRPPHNRRADAQIAAWLFRREKAALDAIVAERQAELAARDPRAKFSITAWIVEHIRADAAEREIKIEDAHDGRAVVTAPKKRQRRGDAK